MSRQPNMPEPMRFDGNEDTSEDEAFGRVGWFGRTSHQLAQLRPQFMPFGFIALCLLAFSLGLPALEKGIGLLLGHVHSGLSGLSAWFSGADQWLAPTARQELIGPLAWIWSMVISVLLVLGGHPLEPDPGNLGYVVPGSSRLARLWAVVGKRFFQIKHAGLSLLAYFRDFNLRKLHWPFSGAAFLFLALFGLRAALANLLFELPVRLTSLQGSTGWIDPTAWALAGLVILTLGVPMWLNNLQRVHRASVKLRAKKESSWPRRLLKGWVSLLVVAPPLLWMILYLLASSGAL